MSILSNISIPYVVVLTHVDEYLAELDDGKTAIYHPNILAELYTKVRAVLGTEPLIVNPRANKYTAVHIIQTLLENYCKWFMGSKVKMQSGMLPDMRKSCLPPFLGSRSCPSSQPMWRRIPWV